MRPVLLLLVLVSSAVAAEFSQECPHNPALPSYPLIARAARVEGTVELRISVDDAGKATATPVKGPPMLVQTSMNVVEQWRFSSGKARNFKMNFIFHVYDPNSKVESNGCAVSKILIDFPNVEIWAALPVVNTTMQPKK